MMKSLVMTIIGEDRPGLVEALSAIIDEHGGNWEESRMVHLAGEFAGLVHVQVPRDRAGELERALGGLKGLSVVVARAQEGEPLPADAHFLELEVIGQDHPGIVHRLAQAIAAERINIEELETEIVDAPMSGEPLFQARARLRAPKSVTLEDLERDLQRVAADLMVDIRLEEPEAS